MSEFRQATWAAIHGLLLSLAGGVPLQSVPPGPEDEEEEEQICRDAC